MRSMFRSEGEVELSEDFHRYGDGMSTRECACSFGESLLLAFAYEVFGLRLAHRSTVEQFGGAHSARKALHGHNAACLCS